jgi:uncharacterized membrane protein affecting hemolysin expression
MIVAIVLVVIALLILIGFAISKWRKGKLADKRLAPSRDEQAEQAVAAAAAS